MRRIDPGLRVLLAFVTVLIALLPALPGLAASPTAIYRFAKQEVADVDA